MTLKPSLLSLVAIPNPIPLLDPVTSAVFMVHSPCFNVSSTCLLGLAESNMAVGPDRMDTGTWAWLTFLGCAASGFFGGTITYSPGIFHVALMEKYQRDATLTSLVGAICSGLLYLTGPLSGILVKKLTCRFTHCLGGILIFVGFSCSFFAIDLVHLFFTYSLLAGLGTGLCATAYSVVPVYRFEKKLGMIVGIQMIGGGLSLIVGGPLVQYFLDTFGLQGAYLVLGAFGSNLIICGLLMKPSSVELQANRTRDKFTSNEKQYKSKSFVQRKLLSIRKCCDDGFVFKLVKDPGFLFIYISSFLWHIPAAAFQVHIPNYSVTKGSTANEAAFLFIIIGIFSIIGRVLTGISIGPLAVGPLKLEIICLTVLGLGTSVLPLYSSTYIGQGVYSGLYGLIVGALTTLFSPICFRFALMEDAAAAIGLRYFIGGISYIIGPTIVGIIIDMGGSYEHGFYLCGGLFLAGAVFDVISFVLYRRSSHVKKVLERESAVEKEIPLLDKKILGSESSNTSPMLELDCNYKEVKQHCVER